MADRVLIVTVGGSPEPVIAVIKRHKPDRVFFLCSTASSKEVDGPGRQAGNIVAQCGLQENAYSKLEVGDPDDLAACLTSAAEAYDAADRDAAIVADYTGGTKTMSAALACVATGAYASRTERISVVTGQRDGLRTVISGTEIVRRQEASPLILEEQWRAGLVLANGYHYAPAVALLEPIMSEHTPPKALADKTTRLITLCRGFEAWDRFDHAEAFKHLQHGGRAVGAWLGDLALLRDAEEQPVEWGPKCVLPVYDLLLNADRRAAQGRYDDAAARLYRSLELMAQKRLWTLGINSANVETAKVAGWLATVPVQRAQQSPLQTGLREDYEILSSLGDPVGQVYREHGEALRLTLQRRNASILAHGTQPIGVRGWDGMVATVPAFISQVVLTTGVKVRPPEQFPRWQPAEFSEAQR